MKMAEKSGDIRQFSGVLMPYLLFFFKKIEKTT
jgi:hypothetical protein